jgi:D-alanyl-D-alanine carboxypeptidase/D-alanyl-D-alanine-endopeptidase (penicillin-binding protein 4)
MFKVLISSLFLFFSSLSIAASDNAFPVSDADFAALPSGAEASLMVMDLKSNKTLYSYHEETLRPPASVQKLVTALAARLELGADYRFSTDIETRGNDVIFRFSGDPSLRTDDIRKLVEKLKHETSIIRGNLYLNGAVFDEFELADGLPWDNLGVCYSAPSSTMSLDDNCAVAKMIYTDNQQTKIDFQVSRDAPITIHQHLDLTDGLEKRYCKFKLMANDHNEYTLGGCLGRNKIPRFLNFAIQNTELFVAEVIRRELKHAGIELQGKIIRNDRASGKIVAHHESESLMVLLDEMLKDSDNLIADNLLKMVGRHYFSEAGGFDNGVAAVKAILKDKAGIDLDNAMLADGSGLSRNNRITASQVIAVLSYIVSHPELKLLDAMAESGKSGTLRYRYSLRTDALKGKVRGKTGSLYGTYNLAGILTTQSGRHLLFVQMVTNYHHPEYHRHDKREIRRFERKLYQSLYSIK